MEVAWDEGIKARLKEAMRRSALTQKGLAEKLGTSESNVSNWINRNTEPTWEMLAAICRVTKVSADWLLDLPTDHVPLDPPPDERLIRTLKSEARKMSAQAMKLNEIAESQVRPRTRRTSPDGTRQRGQR